MMPRPRWSRQSTLLERYLGELNSTPRVEPPVDLDPDLADLAWRLTSARQRLQPPAPFVEALRRQIEASGDDITPLSHVWRRPTIDRRRPAPPSIPDAGEPETEDTVMSRVAGAPDDAPFTLPRRLAHEWLKIAAAAVMFVLVGVVLALTLRDDEAQHAAPVPASTPTAIVPTIPVGEYLAEIEAGRLPNDIVVGAGAVWVPNLREGTLLRVDPAANEVVATIAIMDPPQTAPAVPPMTVTASDGAVWVTRALGAPFMAEHSWELLRIDPSTDVVEVTTTLDIDPFAIAYADGSVWIAGHYSNIVARVDAQTGEVIASVELSGPAGFTVGDGAVWVIGGTDDGSVSVSRIDVATNQVVASFDVSGVPDDATDAWMWFRWKRLGFADGSLWLSNPSQDTVVRVDPATLDALATIEVEDAGTLGAGQAGVFVSSLGDGSVRRIDPATNQVVLTYPPIRNQGYVAFDVGDSAVWLALPFGGQDNAPGVIARIAP
jgi:hypothetical protein